MADSIKFQLLGDKLMQLIQARLTGEPRTIKTQEGDQIFIMAIDDSGNEYTLWLDEASRYLSNGSPVQLQLDPNGKTKIVDNRSLKLPFETEMKLRHQLKFKSQSQCDRNF